MWVRVPPRAQRMKSQPLATTLPSVQAVQTISKYGPSDRGLVMASQSRRVSIYPHQVWLTVWLTVVVHGSPGVVNDGLSSIYYIY